MNRYRPVRRRSSRFHAGPLVAFLIIASFGILFAGCGKGSTAIHGPDGAKTDDFTFTQDDLARFQHLASSGSVLSASGGMLSSLPNLAATGAALPTEPPVLDLSMVPQYDAIRSTGSSAGQNLYRVTNSFLNVRTQPSATSPLLERLNGGDTLTVIEFPNAGWAKVQLADTKTGFAAVQYIGKLTSQDHLADDKRAFDNLYYVHFAFVNVRAKPDQKSEKIGQIMSNTFVRPLSMDKQWARVTFQGKEGYVSTEYLAPFLPTFITRQESFTLPILRYRVSQSGVLDVLQEQLPKLKQAGVTFLTFRDVQSILVQQEQHKDASIPKKAVLIAITDVTPDTVRRASDILYGQNVPASFFLQTKDVGMQGVTQKMIVTLIADGFDIQSAGHSGDDLRSLTDAQVTLEVQQSRKLLEEATGKPVFALDYPQGGVNDRVAKIVASSGYLFGLANAPEKQFTRDQLLRLPSYSIVSGMAVEDILRMVQ